MKKILVVLGLVLSVSSFQASAATVNLGVVNGHKGFHSDVKGNFSDTFTFTAASNNGIGAIASNMGLLLYNLTMTGTISNFAAKLDGISLGTLSSGLANVLAGTIPGSNAGSHTLLFTGKAGSGASYGGDITVAVAQTPIPAAVWLFGSALAGLVGATRRKHA